MKSLRKFACTRLTWCSDPSRPSSAQRQRLLHFVQKACRSPPAEHLQSLEPKGPSTLTAQ